MLISHSGRKSSHHSWFYAQLLSSCERAFMINWSCREQIFLIQYKNKQQQIYHITREWFARDWKRLSIVCNRFGSFLLIAKFHFLITDYKTKTKYQNKTTNFLYHHIVFGFRYLNIFYRSYGIIDKNKWLLKELLVFV